MTMSLIFNELSIAEPASHPVVARQWVLGLYNIITTAVSHGMDNIVHFHEGFWASPLADGYTFGNWFNDPDVELELRQAMASLASSGSWVEDLCLSEQAEREVSLDVRCNGALGLGITLAVLRDHAVMSVASSAPWNDDPLRVDVVEHRNGTERAMEQRKAEICNLHSPVIFERRLTWIAQRCCIKPCYENPGHHDPSSPNFRGGGSLTTPLPDDAEEVYQASVPVDPSGDSWWGQNSDGYLYRYQVSRRGDKLLAHWNGTTDPTSGRVIEDREIPASIRARFPDRRRS